VGQIVGYVQINKTWVHHNNSYECAAWWEDSEIVTGKYPLFLKENYLAPKNLILGCIFDAIVVDAYFPAMLGGVAFSNKGSKERIGGKRTIHHSFDIVEAIGKTGNIPGSDKDFVLNPLLWDGFIESARINLNHYQQMFMNDWETYRKEGDGNYNSNLSRIRYLSVKIQDLANAIDRMKRSKEKIGNASEHMANIYSENVSWVNAA
jgi:hypothetical protein